ncbi:uncharacterized protein LOC105683952 [Athalia rosae]|uniref:uncharacterized protein LOC105683952 n=1 Tax=Athalia rosae TaxID=37344 RepID=UPI000A0ED4D5|nr:uncharacterized protein LOC105683952 [Athalia rosae]
MSGFVIVTVLLIFEAFYLPLSHTLSTKGDIKVEVRVPKEAEVGKKVNLTCEWRLTGTSKLYTVKWYKDDHEFFRYVPENHPRIQTFPQPGVYLDKQANTENSIRLTNLTLESSGQYKCEVSTEAPSFATTFLSANLTVVALPERPPEITGLSSQYAVGENVTANCTTWPSHPRASMSWTINGEPVPAENTIIYRYPSFWSSVGSRGILGLRLEADARYFEGDGGTATLRCIATVGSREYITENRVIMAHVNNQRLSAGDMLRGCASEIRSTLNPTIILFSILFLFMFSHRVDILSTT